MSQMFIIGLLLTSAVQICIGNWIGTFTMSGTCNATACCCAEDPITIAAGGTGVAESTIKRPGASCMASTNLVLQITNPATPSTVNVTDGGSFSLSGDALTVELYLKDPINAALAIPGCPQSFIRQTNTSVITTGNNTTTDPTGNDGCSNKASLMIQLVSIFVFFSTVSMWR